MKKKKDERDFYMFHGKHVYYKLIDDTSGEKRIRKEFENVQPGRNVIIAKDSEKGNGSKNYMMFNDTEELRLFVNKLPVKDRCLYEYRRETDDVKLFFDIDLKLKSDTEKLSFDLSKIFLETVIDSLKFSIQHMLVDKFIQVRDEDFYIYDSSTSAKLSYHIIVNRYYIKSKNIFYLREIKKYATELLKARFKDLIDDRAINHAIDDSVYNRSGCFRLLGSHKSNQCNIKKGYSKQSDVNSFSRSMICVIDYKTSTELNIPPVVGWEASSKECLVENTRSDSQYEEIIENQSLKNSTIEFILKNLNFERANEYGKWIRVGFVLKNLGCSEEVFHRFSKQSDKYNEKECSKVYSSLIIPPRTENRLKIGSLLMWLKEDSPSAFQEFQKNHNDRGLHHYIQTLDLTKEYIVDKGFTYIEINEKYLKYEYIDCNNDILIKSFLGTGKTDVICKLPEITDHSKNILIVPPRRLQSQDNYLRYNFVGEDGTPKNGINIYLDAKCIFDESSMYKRIICQPESFHLIPLDIVYDLVILDESESSLMQFQSDTMKTRDEEKYKRIPSTSTGAPTGIPIGVWDRYEEACIRLKKFCHEAKRGICADAFLSKKSIETYKLFRRGGDTKSSSNSSQPIFLNNLYVPEKCTVENIPVAKFPRSKKENLNPFYDKIIEELENGKKCFCIFSSNQNLPNFLYD
jgi:hypothetical protein